MKVWLVNYGLRWTENIWTVTLSLHLVGEVLQQCIKCYQSYPGWQTWSIMTIMLWHGMIMLIHNPIVWSGQNHGMGIIKYIMIMAWPSWKIAWSCLTHHGQYYYVVWTLIIQSIFKISIQMPCGSPKIFNAEYVEPIHQKLPERLLIKKIFFPKIQIYQKKRKAIIIYFIWKL